jgi:hypothetical protein
MGADISLFSGYAGRENRTTNYCLLLLKLLYEENPKFLGEVLSNLIADELADVVGVQFQQQARKKNCVPDGLVLQRAFSVYIETKTFDWFYDQQLEAHLAALDREAPGVKALLALGNFENLAGSRFAKIEALCAGNYRGSIFFSAVSFEDFVEALPQDKVSKNLADTIDDFVAYLDEEGLLPRWKHMLDVVNCSGLPGDIINENVYMCPAKGGAYNHARAKYFGMYQWKSVRKIALIEAVVELDQEGNGQVRWKHVATPDEALVARAQEKKIKLRPKAEAVRVFLLGPLQDTDFKKPTKGGMQTSKRYFDIERVGAADEVELAAKLRGKTWANY